MGRFIGTREAFAAALIDLAEFDSRFVMVSTDSLKAMRSNTFAEIHPESYIEVGIAEQSAVDVAAGLATCNLVPYVATYAGFLTMRACEQMRTFVAYPNLNVKFVGVNSGLIGGEREGVSHQFYEDLAILSSFPNFTIFTPADANQTYKACLEAAKIDGPVYIRAGSGREIDIYSPEAPFSSDGFTILKDYGDDVLVLASGFILDRVMEAADILNEQELHIKVTDVNILHGKNNARLVDLIKQAQQIVTIEDHNINGGLGAYITYLTSENHPIPVKRIGLTSFGESGPAKELADHYGFSPEALAKSIKTEYKIKLTADNEKY